jgi:hypothetical protein
VVALYGWISRIITIFIYAFALGVAWRNANYAIAPMKKYLPRLATKYFVMVASMKSWGGNNDEGDMG